MGGIAASQEVLPYLLDVLAHAAIGADNLCLDAEMRANTPAENTEAEIALRRTSLLLLQSAFKRLMHDREGRKRISLTHDVLDAGVECRRDLVLKMPIVLRYREAAALPQSIIRLPDVIEHDQNGIGPQSFRKDNEILARVVLLF